MGRSHNCHLSRHETSIQLSLNLHNMEPTHNCHSSYRTQVDLYSTVTHSTQDTHTSVTRPVQYGTCTPKPGFLRVTPHRRAVCGWGRGIPCYLGSSFPTSHTPSKKAELGGVGRKERTQAVWGTTLQIYNHLATCY